MSAVIFPIVEIAGSKFQTAIDVKLYNKEVIVAALYKFSHLFYIHQMTNSAVSSVVDVIFESKDGSVVTPEVPKQFCNELIDQQIRYNTNMQFGHIRDMIVEEAFRPVTSQQK